jgi:hypothetical protein
MKFQTVPYFQYRKLLSKHEQPFSLKYFNLSFITGLAATGALGGLCFGYDNGIVGPASLFLKEDFPMITVE